MMCSNSPMALLNVSLNYIFKSGRTKYSNTLRPEFVHFMKIDFIYDMIKYYVNAKTIGFGLEFENLVKSINSVEIESLHY